MCLGWVVEVVLVWGWMSLSLGVYEVLTWYLSSQGVEIRASVDWNPNGWNPVMQMFGFALKPNGKVDAAMSQCRCHNPASKGARVGSSTGHVEAATTRKDSKPARSY